MTTAHSLPAELTIYTVGELRPQWLDWLAALREEATTALDETVMVDAAAVNEVDAAGVQLLLSLANALHANHRVLRLHQASHTLAQACTALGAQALLADAATVGATA